ncbi:MAG: CCA tRNA nucleotidyltransferase [Weeksellaceae bacterium]
MMTLPDFVQAFISNFKKHNFEIFVVGGTVRGLVMKRETTDWDFTTNATPEEIMKLYPDSFYNNQFGTVGIPQDIDGKQTVFEVTTYRTETSYTNTRHPDAVVWAKTVEEDLSRRDFTINAMAYDGKTLIDPYGGQADIEKQIIKSVGEPDTRFNEDALRLMRAVRQAAQLGFTIEEKTHESIKKNAELITKISWERIRDELFKLLSSTHPADGIMLLKETGLLQHILPEVEASFAISQVSPKRHHIYDVGTHLVESLRHCESTDPVTRLATLIHDIGKVKTYRKDETGLITFYNHEVVGAKQAEVIADRLKLSNKQKDKLVTLVAHHQFTVTEEQTDKAIRRFIRNVTLEYLDDMIALRLADRIGSGAAPTSWRTELFRKRLEEVQQVPFSISDLKINGHDVMQTLGIDPGPQIGKVLEEIFAEVEEGKLQNERDGLLKKLEELKST